MYARHDYSTLDLGGDLTLEMWCVCPELATTPGSLDSAKGQTSGGWVNRAEDRKAGTDIPIGGCLCNTNLVLPDGDRIELRPTVLKRLIVTPES